VVVPTRYRVRIAVPQPQLRCAATSSTRWWVHLGWACWLAVVLSIWGPAHPASAHANVESISPPNESVVPAAPSEVALYFDENVLLDLGGGIKVFAPNGERVDRSRSVLRDRSRTVAVAIDDRGRGTYTVTWRVVSDDSHVIVGSSVFHVIEATGAVAIDDEQVSPQLRWFSRWFVFTSAVVFGGALLLARHGHAGATRRLAIVVAAELLLASLLRHAVQVSQASGRSLWKGAPLWIDAIRTTRAGHLDMFRFVCALIVFLAAAMWTKKGAVQVGSIALVGVFVANALNGHAWTAGTRAITVASDVAHQASVAVWAGGLVALLVAVRSVTDPTPIVRTFSGIALRAVAVVVATGAWASYEQVGSVRSAFETRYGNFVVFKVLVVTVMLALGFLHRQRLKHQIADSVSRRGIGVEALLGIVVLGLTASLTGAVPPKSALPSDPFYVRLEQRGLAADVTVFPARTGPNSLHLYFYDSTGNPTDTVDAADATIEAKDIPARRISLQPISGDHYSALSFTIPRPGKWTIRLTTVRRGKPDEFVIEVPIK
jgi:copper transport protein